MKKELLFAEPFRIFFPLGLLLGAIGVSLWPLFYWHVILVYPSAPHMRLMIEGFMGSFVIGFLGTAGPRLLESSPLNAAEVVLLVLLQVVSSGLHLAHEQLAGDLCFFALLIFFLASLVRRVQRREDLPPPGFVLVLGGFVNAIAGILLLMAERQFWVLQLGTILLNEGFILFPILGVGAFFYPKLLDSEPVQPRDLLVARRAWRKGALVAVSVALLLWASFVIEALAWPRSAGMLRSLTSLAFLALPGQLFQRRARRTFLSGCFQLGALLLIAGLFLPVLFPTYRIANLHVVFLGGFSIILFTVSTRVIVGHSGQSHLFQGRLRFLVTALGLLVLAMLTRVSADIFPVQRNSHLVYAALIWLVAACVWAGALVPKLRLSED